jgi:hypothetical protein
MMRRFRLLTIALGIAALGATFVATELRGDEPRGLGRFFRFGNRAGSDSSNGGRSRTNAKEDAPVPTNDKDLAPRAFSSRARSDRAPLEASARSSENAISSPYRANSANPYGGPAGASRPDAVESLGVGAGGGGGPGSAGSVGRLVPQPRVSRPITEAPPILTRIQLGRSDDGHSFGMFLQIYADGTVIDTEGVHRLPTAELKPLVEALRAADVGRIRGHCGGPAVDFVEHVQLIVYDQARGRIQANAFSYSGNLQGCSSELQALQSAIHAVQAKVSPATVARPNPSAVGGDPARALAVGAGPADEPADATATDDVPPPPLLPLPDTSLGATPPSSAPIRLSPAD